MERIRPQSVGRGSRITNQQNQRYANMSDLFKNTENHIGNKNEQKEQGQFDESSGNLKFKEACEKIRKSTEKYLNDTVLEESSSSEDELDSSSIIQKTFQKYQSGGSDLNKTQALLEDSLTSGAIVCLICIESVKRNDSIWSCHSCYCIMHLSCIQRWAKDSLYHQTINSTSDATVETKWCCPKCRYEYESANVPSSYYCFCGKVENPPFDSWNLPHSCGQTCAKKLQPLCGHECLLLCHPGPCPPCPKTVKIVCYCGKSKPVSRRCSNKYWTCSNKCKKLLSCKLHYCEELCHGGDCPPCHRQSIQKCLCGSEEKLRPCDDPTWQCAKACTKPLDCGNHLCLVTCHSGPCASCPKSGPRPCPCKKKISWLPCTEEVPPCGDTCDKLLACGMHRCSQRCHYGDCGECLQMRVMQCRCGQKEKAMPCSKEFTCDIKCKRRKDCGKHNCNRKCCAGNCLPCEAPCGHTLNCGAHKCKSRCHRGLCFPCRETVEITCNCKSTKISIPCGRKKSAIPPRCSANCKLPADCHHEHRQKHRCHFGACPPCSLTCVKTLNCGHTCPSRCHSAVLTKVENKKKKEGPWDLVNSFKMELVCKSCPPCNVPISLSCLGGHVVHEFPCHAVRPWSCGRPCNRSLLCGNHTCELECHDPGESQNSTEQSTNCQSCERPCSKSRPEGCNHECHRSCHNYECPPCLEIIKMKCHCQLSFLFITCKEWTNADAEKRNELLSCKNTCPKELSCGHRCTLPCHNGPCPDRINCKKKTVIRCSCKRLKKDIICFSLVDGPKSLECDEECRKQKQQIEALEAANKEKIKEEEKRQQELQLQEFLRKTEGKKKKRKKVKDVEEKEQSFLRRYAISLGSSCIVVMAFFVFFYRENFV